MRLIFALLASLAVVPMAQAQDSYRIRPGDVLRVEVLEDPSMTRETLVLPDGRISMPLAGAVSVAGRDVEEVQGNISKLLAANFATEPTVYVTVNRLAEVRPAQASGGGVRAVKVYVLGEALKPGRHEVARGTTLLQLFAEMGGFSKFAATKRVQLRRTDRAGKEAIYAVDYDALMKGASGIGGTVLTDGDVVIIPQRRLFE